MTRLSEDMDGGSQGQCAPGADGYIVYSHWAGSTKCYVRIVRETRCFYWVESVFETWRDGSYDVPVTDRRRVSKHHVTLLPDSIWAVRS